MTACEYLDGAWCKDGTCSICKLDAEVTALRAEVERLMKEREWTWHAEAKQMEARARDAEAALATERARALEEAEKVALVCVFDAIHEQCGKEINMEPLRERISRNIRALASPPPAPCDTCNGSTMVLNDHGEPDLEALDLDDLVVPPPQGEWHSLHEKCEAEIAALRAEATGYAEQAAQTRLDADREIDSLATSLAKALDGKAAAEAALATERARALEVVALLTEAHDWGVGASNRFPYLSHGMLCMAIRTRGVERPCDCGLVEWYDRVVAATASPPPAPAPQGEEDGFEGHPPGVCLEHDRFRLEGAGLIDTEGHFDRCTGCGQLPPHAGCKAICAACAPPTGACYCAGCQVAGKASPPTAPAPQGEERCPECVRQGRPWHSRKDCPHHAGRAPRAEEGT